MGWRCAAADPEGASMLQLPPQEWETPMPAEHEDELEEPRLYINRELSLLEFNRRVLEQALDPNIPLLERLRFLSISSSILDEFFEIRVASHKERANWGAGSVGLDGLTSSQTLAAISRSATELVTEQYRTLNEVLLPELEGEGIRVLSNNSWSDEQWLWIKEYFRSEVLPVLTPVGLDPSHPFPRILNKSLNLMVQLEGQDAFGRASELAVVQVPRGLPRILRIGPGEADDHVLLSSIIQENIGELFPGMGVISCHQFRVTRNGDLWVDEEEVDDILQALRGELPERRYSEAVRLELAQGCPAEVTRYLLERFDLQEEDLYRVNGPVNLHRLEALHDIDRPDLKYEPFSPRVPRRAQRGDSPFEAVGANDILLHHPYESFSPVLDLLRSAATDPDVVGIKMTLYRTGRRSQVVDALIGAARSGKQVTVIIELRARFDEERNIGLATRLQEAGASVTYGVVGFKTHSKMMMIVRREGGALRRYVHLGTGNYNAETARTYTDLGFLTARPEYGRDVDRIFNQLTGVGHTVDLERLLQAPFTLHKTLLRMIEEEAEFAVRGEPGRVIAKMNALTNKAVIKALYRASRAGVKIDLIVRGACCLRPGIPGVSENITVRSVLGRFLEHSRLFYFGAGGDGVLYCSSADWMSRNLMRRIETCFPIEDPAIRDRLLREDLENYLGEDVHGWELHSTGEYKRCAEPEHGTRDAQAALIQGICSPDDPHLEAEQEAPTREGKKSKRRNRKKQKGKPRKKG